jgi:hypothetical protein
MTATETTENSAELDALSARMVAQLDAYHRVGPLADQLGWALWMCCARNAAWCRLLAASWQQVSEAVPTGLLAQAALNSTLHYDSARAQWRSLALAVAREQRCAEPAPVSGDECTLITGHPGRHRDPSHGVDR